MPHTDDDTILATAIRDLINANKNDFGIDDVLYGYHIMIPRASAVIVQAAGYIKNLVGVQGPGGRADNQLNVGIDVHISAVGDEETERRKVDDLSKLITTLLHEDTTVGGIIIHGFVNGATRGNTIMANNSMFRTVQMTFVGRTRTLIQ